MKNLECLSIRPIDEGIVDLCFLWEMGTTQGFLAEITSQDLSKQTLPAYVGEEMFCILAGDSRSTFCTALCYLLTRSAYHLVVQVPPNHSVLMLV